MVLVAHTVEAIVCVCSETETADTARCDVLSANPLQAINDGIDDGTLSDIEESTKSKYYEYDTDWESSREGLLIQCCVAYLTFYLEYFDTGK